MTMDLDWLKDFLALAEQGTFSRAAEARNVTQPAFSRRIRALEAWIGVPLFVRSAQGAALTAAGDHLRPHVHDAIRALERARQEARAVGTRQAASLSIAATHALSFTFFPGWVRRINLDTAGPIHLISDSMEACEQILLSGEVHFLLCHHHSAAPVHLDTDRYPAVRLGTDTLAPLCAADAKGQPLWRLPIRTGTPVRVLGYSPASGLGRILAAHHASVAEVTGVEAVFTSHLAATLMTMAREGHGVAWLPLSMAAADLDAGTLVRAGPQSCDIVLDILLFRSPDCRNEMADRLWRSLTT